MRKHFLFAATAFTALAIAGTASAQHTLTYRAAGAAGQITLGDTYGGPAAGPDSTTTDTAKYGRSLVGSYLIAQEALTPTAVGSLALQDAIAGGSLPSGNNLYTLSLSNATFGAAVTGANLAGANCTTVIQSGGGANDSTVTFLVSSSGGGNCAGFTTVDVPVRPSGPGSVNVTSNYTTEAGLPFAGGPSTLFAIFAIDAIQPTVNGNLVAAGAEADTFAALLPLVGGMPYTTLGGDNILGKVAIYIDTRGELTLDPAGANAAVTDVTAATLTVTGDFSAFDGAAGAAGNPTITFPGGAPVAGTVAGTTTTFAGVQGTAGAGIVQLLTSKPNGSGFRVTPDGAMINPSDYAANIAFNLSAAYVAQPNQPGAFERIDREGTNFIAPWTGGSQAGSQSVIRLSNTGNATGNVTVVLTNGLATGNVAIADGSCNLGPVPAAGDLVIGQPQLAACFPAFARGDLLITVEGLAANLTAKMRNTSAAGTFETTLGRYSGSTIAGAAQ